jgi:hypothetical protein
MAAAMPHRRCSIGADGTKLMGGILLQPRVEHHPRRAAPMPFANEAAKGERMEGQHQGVAGLDGW